MALNLISLQKYNQPVLNEPATGSLFESNVHYITKNLYSQLKNTTELLAMLDTVINDHFLGNVDFFDINGKPLGSTKLKQIKKLWEDNQIQEHAFYGQALDFFVDGSSFGWYTNAFQQMDITQKNTIKKLKILNPEIGNYTEEQAHLPRKISYLAASTVSIINDKHLELYYIQNVNGERIRWDTNQIVHIKQMEFNGEMRGMSTLKALVKEIVMMLMLKDNIIAKLENGGSADNIIALKGANGVSKARFERLQTALESFSHLRKSHGNMPIDAEVTVHPLGTALKDMEYRELAMFIISEFALSLSLPTSRVPFLMTGSGGSSNKGELSGNSEDAYQSKINTRRKKWENAWNKIFYNAGFTFRFRKDNLLDDVRETQASVQRVSYVNEIQNSLFKSDKQLKLDAHLQLLSGTKINICNDDVEDLPEEKLNAMNMNSSIAGIGGKMQPSNLDGATKVTHDRSEAKKKTAFNNGRYN
jgi:hypothetical protein